MSSINQFSSLLTLSGVVAVVALLVVIAVLLWKNLERHPQVRLSFELQEQINLLRRAAEHYTNVSAVVAMLQQLDELDEDAVVLLSRYPQSVRAAAWLHYINCLGSDLQLAQQQLSDAHQGVGRYSRANGFYSSLPDAREDCQTQVNDLRAKLDEAIKLSGQSGGLRSI